MKRLIHSFTVRKVMELLLTLLIVTFLSFLLVKLSPVDAAEAYARTERGSEMRSILISGLLWLTDGLFLEKCPAQWVSR